ncbi:MAG: biotin/lipoyl-binding protein [Gemmatimonadota bacterium]|nr:biotin/lipoyl-binding protein [Gemmatimonadota bacterium]
MRYFVSVAGEELEVELGDEATTVEGGIVEADLARVEGTDVHHLLLDGVSHRVVATREGKGAWVLHVGGRRYSVGVEDERTRTIRRMAGVGQGSGGPRPVRAPMPGLVVKVEVMEGDVVEEGRGVVIVEAMKMENELRAETAGKVRRVLVAPGDAVEKDQILVELDPLDGEDPTDG